MKSPLRLVLAFFAAYGLNTTLHESAHAFTAHLLGLSATLFHFYVNIDYAGADSRSRILCSVAGPLFSLAFGAFCWVLYKKLQGRPEGLLLFYSSILGISIFLGNLFSTSLVAGDFGVAATQWNLPASARLATTLAGGLLLALFLYRMGPELLRWTSPQPAALKAAVQAIVWPVVLGTTLVIIAFLPLPRTFIQDWIATSSFWIFAAVGVVTAHRRAPVGKEDYLSVHVFEMLAAAGVLLLVRVLARGVYLAP